MSSPLAPILSLNHPCIVTQPQTAPQIEQFPHRGITDQAFVAEFHDDCDTVIGDCADRQ